MLWSEFVTGTGCKDSEHNYKVYKDLEVMYMNSDMSKSEIYEYGKKLVDNSKSESELKLEAEIKAEIKDLKDRIEYCKREIEYEKRNLEYWKEQKEKFMAGIKRDSINYYKNEIRIARNKITALKSILD